MVCIGTVRPLPAIAGSRAGVEYMQTKLMDLRELLEPTIEYLGYELVHLEFGLQGKDRVLRLYIDAPGGIQIDDCELVSRQVSLVLDVEDPLSVQYVLEVSSPGLDRPLVKPAHFRQFLGDTVKVVMGNYVFGRRRFTGRLIEATEELAVVEVDGETYELIYGDMVSARLEPVF